MITKNKGKQFLAELKLYSDFLGWDDSRGRMETWEEAVDDIFTSTHEVKYKEHLDELKPFFDFAKKYYKEKKSLGSMRGLQFRGNDIFKHEFRLYNCLVMYADKPEWIGNAFYLSLCGCGVGVNLMLPFIKRLPNITKRTKGTKTFVISDSIEGWMDASNVLITSFLASNPIEGYEQYQGFEIKFDASKIRPKGAKVGRRFLAPGPKGLVNALNKVEELLNNYLNEDDGLYEVISKPFKSIIAYDCFMHFMNAVLSGGIRRAAASVIFSPEDQDMLNCKAGNWYANNKQRERSNNSVGLLKGTFTKEEFKAILALNKGGNDVGFVIMNNIFEIYNPCFEIGFTPLYFDTLLSWEATQALKQRVMQSDITVLDEGVKTAIQCCNLTEGSGGKVNTKKDFLDMIYAETVMGSVQADYTNFKHIRGCLAETIAICKEEALLGISIAGLMGSPLFDHPDWLEEGAKLMLDINARIANIIGTNPCARGTCIKPGGDGPILLEDLPGTTPGHSRRGFRCVQLNKDTETAKYLVENMPWLLEESTYSANNTDYVVFVPVENDSDTKLKSDIHGVDHLKLVKILMDHWVKPGKVESRCIIPTTSHNVSNTIVVHEDEYEAVTDYIYNNQDSFRAVAFAAPELDKDYNQCPNTSVLTGEEIMTKYGEASMFASGLVVDALHAFDDNLWDACNAALHPDKDDPEYYKITGSRVEVMIKKDIVRRFKKFAKNYFKGNLQEIVYCLKDVHLYHKWRSITRQFKEIDFTEILTKPTYIDIDSIAAKSCSGGSCNI